MNKRIEIRDCNFVRTDACNLLEVARSAERILVPKGDDCRPAIEAFEQTTGIEVPTFKDRKYSAKSQGRKFFSVKASDVTRLVNNEYADVGVTGKDQYLESDKPSGLSKAASARYEAIGEPMGYLALLSTPKERKQITEWLVFYAGRASDNVLQVTTSFPKIVNMIGASGRCPIQACETYAGSIEVMPKLTGCSAVVDIVSKGRTLEANGLVVVEKLMDVPPVLVGKI